MHLQWLDYHNWETPRWKTAVGSRKMSFPMRRALETGIITTETSVLDFGCGRNNDVESLTKKGIASVGFDPYWNNVPDLLQPTDVVSCIYVLNTIERNWEIPEVIQYCWELTQKSLILAIRTGDDHEENTSIGTYQYYWKTKSWQEFVRAVGFDAEFLEPGIAVIHRKPVSKCYNESVITSTSTMNIKSLRKFLSVSPDKDSTTNVAPITLAHDNGIIDLTYQKSGMLIKLPYTLKDTLDGGEESWSIIVDHSYLMQVLDDVKGNKGDVNLRVVKGDLQISVDDIVLTVFSGLKQIAEFEPDNLDLDSQVIRLNSRGWKHLEAAARIAKLNKKGVNPQIVGKGVHCYAWDNKLTVSAWSESVSCSRIFDIDEDHRVSEAREFVLPLEAIDLVAGMNPSQITMKLDYELKQLLIETDIGYILVDILKDKYPAADGIQKEFDSIVEVKRKDLFDAVQAAAGGGAKNITLIFDNNTVVVEAAKAKKQKVALESDPKKRIATTIKVGATALMEALKAITTTKILMHLPVVDANSLVINTVTGVMYVVVVTAKAVAQVIESAADVLKKPEPTKKTVSSGKNADGTPFAVENVETSPLEANLSIEESEAKSTKLKQEFGEKADLAESVLDVANLREKVRGIVKQIDPEIERLKAMPPSNNDAGIKGLDKVQAGIQQDAEQRLKELTVLREKLATLVSETENVEVALDHTFETEFTLEGLKAVELKLTWWGGRTLQFLWKEEAQWLPQMRLSEPIAR